KTEIGEGVFVGSNSTLVAPIKVDAGAFVAAGSTLNKNVESRDLAVARGKQRNIKGWLSPAAQREKRNS
ncbi:MAG: bifunctional UDP-N-acetylglucosamine diphosphorylase/glucosamine-1-phosphate N-acetyltransferase GlmU, partial [Pseudomonadales bacterium]|nr:bifunctional UDP-N-acetylglucosamine diphosphorylase/glucosamine-1-phosphate N-acetyltransferase GlmU [Pseudomonadales bacterium]